MCVYATTAAMIATIISDMEASNGSEMEIANVQTRHGADYGGYYFADIVMALKKSQPLPAPPDRCTTTTTTVAMATATAVTVRYQRQRRRL